MVGIQIGKEQEERKREEEGLDFETTPWWNFITIMGYADEELRSASLLKLRAQPTAKAKAIIYYIVEVSMFKVSHSNSKVVKRMTDSVLA